MLSLLCHAGDVAGFNCVVSTSRIYAVHQVAVASLGSVESDMITSGFLSTEKNSLHAKNRHDCSIGVCTFYNRMRSKRRIQEVFFPMGIGGSRARTLKQNVKLSVYFYVLLQ